MTNGESFCEGCGFEPVVESLSPWLHSSSENKTEGNLILGSGLLFLGVQIEIKALFIF